MRTQTHMKDLAVILGTAALTVVVATLLLAPEERSPRAIH